MATKTLVARAARKSGLDTTSVSSSKRSSVVLVGLDLGTNKSCLLAAKADAREPFVNTIIPSVVGYAKAGIIDRILPGNAKTLFGQEALTNALHANLVAPLKEGVIADTTAALDFFQHLKRQIDPSGETEVRAVIGIPANADQAARDSIIKAATGVFDRIMLIPEPFLAALGVREDARLGQGDYVDPVTNSLFIDIGAGTSDLCRIQGYFPTAEDQISVPFAGDAIDSMILEGLSQKYPNHGLTRGKVREIKEANAYVGTQKGSTDVRVILAGKAHVLDLGDLLSRAANALIEKIYPALTKLIAQAPSDTVETLLKNIVITGGGSQIRGIDQVLQQKLTADGFEAPRVRVAGPDYKRYVAIGAMKAAQSARDDQWQVLLGTKRAETVTVAPLSARKAARDHGVAAGR